MDTNDPNWSDRIAVALEDRDDRTRFRVLQRVHGAAAGPDELVRTAICDPDPAIRATAVVAMHRVIDTSSLLRCFISLCDDTDGESRGRAAWALGKMGEDAVPALPALVRLAQTDGVDDARYGSVQALARIGQAARSTEGAVRSVAESDVDYSVRSIALKALGEVGSDSPGTRAVLVTAITADSAIEREEAARALGLLGPAGGNDEILMTAAQNEAGLVREAAVEALGRVGSSSSDVRHALELGLVDSVSSVRTRAGESLHLLGWGDKDYLIPREPSGSETRLDRSSLAPWCEHLDSVVAHDRAAGAWELSIAGPDAVDALPKLRAQAVSDDGSDTQWSACVAIGRTRLADAANITTLQLVANRDTDPDVRAVAIEALGGLGLDDPTPDLIATIESALGDEDSLVREHAAIALGQLGVRALGIRPSVFALLNDPHPSVRRRAAGTLARFDLLAS